MSPRVADIAVAAADWLSAVSWQLVPLVAVVLLLDRLLRRSGPAAPSALWWLVIVKLVVPPTLTSPASLARLAPPLGSGAVGAAPVGADAWTLAMLAAWLCGVVLAGTILLARAARVRRRWLRGATAALPRSLVRGATAAAARLRLRRPPHILVQPAIDRPAVVGFLRPCVVVPPGLASQPPGEIQHALMHELAHVARRDPLASLVTLVAQVVFWFHPLVWLARHRLATLREMSCDRRVVRALGGNPKAYQRTLLRLAPRLLVTPEPAALGLFQRRSQLVARLEALGPLTKAGARRERLIAAAVFAGVLVSCVPLARPVVPESDPPRLDRLPGSLQKRYAVLRWMAEQEQRDR
jgi:beta-lactamase regulating signal transducer with metallopeptidase domain